MEILLNRKGQENCALLSFPVRYGTYHQITTDNLTLHFSPSWRLTHFQGRSSKWPNPLEWIKIGLGGCKTYYSSMAYGDIASLFDQHYIPICEKYPQVASNQNPFLMPYVSRVIEQIKRLPALFEGPKYKEIKQGIQYWNNFYTIDYIRILKSRISILPPDSMICDYQVFPVVISTGCLGNCGFCTVKDGTEFKIRKFQEIKAQIQSLAQILQKDLDQFKGIFLGNLDALNASDELILKVVDLCQETLPFIKNLFLFGSIESFRKKSQRFFKALDQTSLNSYINIGIESFDKKTLFHLKKPMDINMVFDAWHRLNELNRTLLKTEITINILISENFSKRHLATLTDALSIYNPFPKGTVYLSSLNKPYKRVHFEMAKEIKQATSKPVRLYPLVAL